ncbi:thioredoxin family protein [Thalassoroseus pseudoceratinae]|uniref:thioredoxin family protein n=1 Tax=Thalassoroseus pseudoceratinae TaxID=2713176 RepID=UPI00141DF107|nr:thioredoxin family protein [Thalassoroseus pseudoceratinae]
MRSILLTIVTVFAFASSAHAGKFNRQLDVGDKAPSWVGLPGTDGDPHSLKDYEKSSIVVVAFIANHCPMATAYLPRWKQLIAKFEDPDVAFVAISSSRFPADSLDHMKSHAKKHDFTFDYLYDGSQEIGRAYGVFRTPTFFVLDHKRRVRYMGALDDNQNIEQVQYQYLRAAIEAVLRKRDPEVTETLPFGCEIDYAADSAE